MFGRLENLVVEPVAALDPGTANEIHHRVIFSHRKLTTCRLVLLQLVADAQKDEGSLLLTTVQQDLLFL